MTRTLVFTPEAIGGYAEAVAQGARVARLLDGALDVLEDDPCDQGLKSYRLRGPEPWSDLCRLTVANTNIRIVYRLGYRHDLVSVLVIGRHDDDETVYRRVAALHGVALVPKRVLESRRRRCCADGQPKWITRSETQALSAREPRP